MLIRLLKICGWVIFAILIILHVLLLYLGIAYVGTAILFYIALLLIGLKTISNPNIRLSYLIILLTLFAGEMVLRYGVKTLSNPNNYWSGLYISPYRLAKAHNWHHRLFFNQKNLWLRIRKPNSTETWSRSEFEYEHHYNSLGLRDREMPKDTSIFKIVGLGSSFTEGLGTHQDSTWLRFMEKTLSIKLPGKEIVTINGGLIDSDPLDEYMILKELLLPYKPDIVMVVINPSDLEYIMIRGGFERFLPNHTMAYKKGKWWEPFYAMNYTFRYTFHLFKDVDINLLTPDERQEALDSAEDILIKTIQKFRKLGDLYGFRVVFIFHTYANIPAKDIKSIYESMVQDSSALVLNLLNTFQQHPELYYWKEDGHHNKQGYRLWGKTAAAYLIEKGLVKN